MLRSYLLIAFIHYIFFIIGQDNQEDCVENGMFSVQIQEAIAYQEM